jgi:dTDP-4-dehydrorhamnose reductase
MNHVRSKKSKISANMPLTDRTSNVMKKTLVIGATGLVGSRFCELSKSKFEIVAADEKNVDITNSEAVNNYFLNNKFDAVVNFAAYTNVSEGENDRGNKNGLAWKLNVEASENVAKACKEHGVFLVHISTDMVFSGNKADPGPYSEDHLIPEDSSVVTWYGYTKGLGEKAVQNVMGEESCIFRLIYPFRASFEGKLDYLRKPIQLYEEGKLYPLFTDQTFTIAFIDDIAKILDGILEIGAIGIFHAGCTDLGSPYDHVLYALEKIKGGKVELKTGSIEEFLKTASSPVRYPQFGGLKTEKTQEKLGMKFRTWHEMIDEFVSQL